jgi:hypothetical protein
MRDFLADWRRWTVGERIAASLFAVGAVTLLPILPFLTAPH